jgi:phosphonate transport system ATP-binding protein
MSLVELERATVRYDRKTVLSDVSLTIKHGERVALIGESGAGKSALLRTIFEKLGGAASIVPQDFGLVKMLSVFHNVYMGRLHRYSTWRNFRNLVWPERERILEVRAVLARLGLEDAVFWQAGDLSGGQQQRTAVGRALYQNAAVLLGDEPVSAVDEVQSRLILRTINESTETVILAMHDIDLAVAFTDRLIGIKDGKIALDCATSCVQRSELGALYSS